MSEKIYQTTQIEGKLSTIHITYSGDPSTGPVLLFYHAEFLNSELCFGTLLDHPLFKEYLASKFAIVCIDAPGHNENSKDIDKEEKVFSIDNLMSEVDTVVNTLGIEEFVSISCGWLGTYLFLNYALAHSNKFRGMVFIGGSLEACNWFEWSTNKVLETSIKWGFFGAWQAGKIVERYLPSEWIEKNKSTCSKIEKKISQLNPIALHKCFEFCSSRLNLEKKISSLEIQCLNYAGGLSINYEQSLEINSLIETGYSSLINLSHCGTLITVQEPISIIDPLCQFLKGCGFTSVKSPSIKEIKIWKAKEK
eukprot:Anaeramoba_flamelloidesa1072654_30.p1 GENE.a1072654_30~~a1072654_30.p1  ORF type:complete len:308 (-),score=75.00 a1072654_30:20-943(-)